MAEVTVHDQLFETSTGPSGSAPAPVPVGCGVVGGKTFRAYDQDQSFLMPPSLREWLPEDHLAWFVDELVDEVLDVGPFLASYTEARGFPPYHPRLMLKVVLYGYITGVRSSRKIEARCHDDVAFRVLAANGAPDFRSIARFRRRHLPALEALFGEALALCRAAGMVRLGRVALDGTKVKANASRHKAMSYERMCTVEPALAEEVAAMMAEAEDLDTAEDEAHGEHGRGGELAGEMARRQSRLVKIRAAKAALERDAREQAAAKAGPSPTAADGTGADAQATDSTTDPVAGAERGSAVVVRGRAQRNFTDPDARIMKTADGSFHYCYNAQAVVDEDHQVIVATDFAVSSADSPAFPGMLDQTITNTGVVPAQTLADAGYFSQANVEAAEAVGTEALIATGRLRHGEQPTTDPGTAQAPPPDTETPKQRMAHRLRSEAGRGAYARRKVIVEPVFGQMKTTQGAGRLLLRGHDAARAEWRLLAACHNLRKLFNYTITPTPATG